MASVNQRGEEVVVETLFPFSSAQLSEAEMREALDLLCDHLGVRIVRTNATKSGHTEIELQKL